MSINAEDVVAVIQTHDSKGEPCGIRVLFSDLNLETLKKLADISDGWAWDLKCLEQMVMDWKAMRNRMDAIANMNNPDDAYAQVFTEDYRNKMQDKRKIALDTLEFMNGLEQQCPKE